MSKERKIGPLEEEGMLVTPHKGIPIEKVPVALQKRFIHFRQTGEFLHFLDRREMVTYGLVPKIERKKASLIPEEYKEKKREYERLYYQTKRKPKRQELRRYKTL